MTDTKFEPIIGSEPAKQTWEPSYESNLDPPQPNLDEPEESYLRRHLLFGKLSELQDHQRGHTQTYQDFLSTIPVSSEVHKHVHDFEDPPGDQEDLCALTGIPGNQFSDISSIEEPFSSKVLWYNEWTKDPNIRETILYESKLADLVPSIFDYEVTEMEQPKKCTEDEEMLSQENNWEKTEWCGSKNIVDYLQHREMSGRFLPTAPVSESHYMLTMLERNSIREEIIPTSGMNKVFCSTWVDDTNVIFGTKSTELRVFNSDKRTLIDIPLLKGASTLGNHYSNESNMRNTRRIPYSRDLTESPIHFIHQNPSRNFLLTQGTPASTAAVYRLPSLEPFCLGDDGHNDLIFDSCWLDDNFFCTVARDNTACIWKVEDSNWSSTCDNNYNYQIIWPRGRQVTESEDKLRTVAFNSRSSQIVAVTNRSRLLVYDASTFQECLHAFVGSSGACTCLETHPSGSFFASSAYSEVRFFDARTYKVTHRTLARDGMMNSPATPLRSLAFQGDVLSIGFGDGIMYFYDTRARRYITDANGEPMLKCSTNISVNSIDGKVVESSTAIYTHSVDPTGRKMFVGGGSLCYAYDGSYASVWK